MLKTKLIERGILELGPIVTMNSFQSVGMLIVEPQSQAPKVPKLECGSSAGILLILTESLCSSILGEVGVPAYRDHSDSIPRIWVIYPS
jgi:hypothetical protein